MDDLQTDAFFVTVDGKRMYATLVYNIVKRALSKVVCMKKRSPHVLRHTFATSMLNNEAELNVVKELLDMQVWRRLKFTRILLLRN